MDLVTYKTNWSDALTSVSGIEVFTMDDITESNLNNYTYPFILMLPPTDAITQDRKSYKRNEWATVMYLINSKDQKNNDEVVVEWNRLQALLSTGIDNMIAKTDVITTTGNRTFEYFDESIGGNSLLSVRLSLTIVTNNC